MFRRLLLRILFGSPRVIYTPHAPRPVGPYSQAIVSGGLIFGAGQLGIDPASGSIVASSAEGQASQALANMQAVLKAAGSDRSRVVKITVYFKSLDDFDRVNAVYEQFFSGWRPARSAVQVPRIPLDALIELDYVASI